jgi:hypothetical protein
MRRSGARRFTHSGSAVLLAAWAVACAPAPGVREHAVPDAVATVLTAMERSAEVWPDFELRQHVLIATLLPDGPVYLIGDATPPADFAWLDRGRRVAVRRGAPPDSLAVGLQLARDWHGRSGVATAVALPPEMQQYLPHVLVHEAFHTHQNAVGARTDDAFAGRPNPVFADTSAAVIALLNLEAELLGRAVRAGTAPEAERLARLALGVRSRRCVERGAEQCANERGIEQNEGSATYVASRLLGEVLGYGPEGVWQDSLARVLSPLAEAGRLGRWHFYDTGFIWHVLLERFAPAGWQRQVESTPPDVVLAGRFGITADAADSLAAAALATPEAAAQAIHADRFTATLLATRDSAERAFWGRPGVPFRIHFGPVSRVSSAQRRLDDGTVEQTFDFDGNRVIIRGPARSVCCPGQMTVADVTGRGARVDGRTVPLDVPGSASGALEIELPELEIRVPRGELRVFGDSVTVQIIRP